MDMFKDYGVWLISCMALMVFFNMFNFNTQRPDKLEKILKAHKLRYRIK